MTAKSAPAAPPAAAPGAGEQSVEELTELYAGMEFKAFAEENFQLCRKGMFKTKTDLDKVTRWKNELMKLALLNFKDGELQAEALQTNRNVLGFMGDRKSGKDTIDHCTKIMHNMLQSPEELRNEAYCQIMKQTTENPSGESTVLGWKLLAVCLATFPPSDALAPYLGHFCATNVASTQEDGDVKVADVAAFCLKKAWVRVFFLDAKYVTLKVDAWTSGGAIPAGAIDRGPPGRRRRRALLRLRGVDRGRERALDADERVLDLVAYWDRLEREAREKKGKKSEVEEFHRLQAPRRRGSRLDYAKSWKIRGSSYYFAEPKQNRDFPSEVVLAINAKGILVVDPDTKEFLQEYPRSQVVTWGHSTNSFVVVTGDAVKQTKVYFKTEQGKEMNVMVRAYVEALMA
ncbi:myosin-related protein [Aureococcus anophagefferens]|uniref:Myosin-related protein n=1 Tax=Aureococcus anophagefferens TaxID=44056 RepID=A0ABR1FQJ3_AURAN